MLRPSFFVAVAFATFFLLSFLSLFSLVSADPTGAGEVNVIANETSSATAGALLNISGGRIATVNITATVQNSRWKAFVGNVTGSFTLDDASGSTIYDWSITTVSGEVYATTNSSTIVWSSIVCANDTTLEVENTVMGHTSADDNITATFSGTTHAEFFVGAVNLTVNACPTLNTYVSSASQDTSFEEIALYSSGTIVYATIMEQNVVGFDGATYDFQMIVPENGAAGFSGSTAYYLYVELS